jgi:aminoglycoside phosphotransferase (APT) family kinase protein
VLEAALGPLPAPIETEQFPSGHSNLTYLVRCATGEYVLRRPPFGAERIKGGHDMGREFRVLAALAPSYPRVPRPVLFHPADDSPLGVPFYVMERVRGLIVRPADPWLASCSPDLARRMSTALVAALADLHAFEYEAAGLGDFGRPEGYVERQVAGWRGRYGTARTHDVPDMDRVGSWLAERRWRAPRPAFLHNDFKLDNVVLDRADPSRVVAVLDWEMATIGDPLADLGTTLAYWIDPDDPGELRALRFAGAPEGFLTRAQVVDEYARLTGEEVADVVQYYVLALYEVAVIVQQLYYRFSLGETRDARFEAFPAAVRALAAHARRAVERERV